MFRNYSIIILVGIWLFIAAPQAAFADKDLFIKNKCTKCHSVNSEGIKGDKKKKKDKIAPPDLSDAGKYHDAAYFKKWLMKKTYKINHDGTEGTKKHKKKWKGSREDLEIMAKWLESLKNDVPEAK